MVDGWMVILANQDGTYGIEYHMGIYDYIYTEDRARWREIGEAYVQQWTVVG
jgi:hypothetical protein